MCGIFGVVANSNSKKEYYPILQKALNHRGPDHQAELCINQLYFFHARLSIVDLSPEGNQPMQKGKLTIIFNGEIYNHLELRQKYNLRCKSGSDTETLLHLYELLGNNFLNDIDGMFAFAIYDSEKQELFLARDRAGKKPLYYLAQPDQFVFSSELNALAKAVNLYIDDASIASFLYQEGFYRQQTPYKNVEELLPGNFLCVNCNTLSVKQEQWWSINTFYQKSKLNISFEDCKEAIKTNLKTAVKRRLLSSDLEVGAFLSGGIDSGLVTAFASKISSRPIKTFTVSFDGQYNEAHLAKEVAEQFSTDHTEIKISFSELKNDFEKIVLNYGEPFSDSSAIPSYYVSREAKKYITVILNGDGADELFGGYRRYVPFAKINFFTQFEKSDRTFSSIKKLIPDPKEKKSLYNYFYRIINFLSYSGYKRYIATTTDTFIGFENYFHQSQHNNDYYKILRGEYESVMKNKLSGLSSLLNLDFNLILPGHLLVKMDIATMANSLEGRSPFLSKELLEFAPQIPDTYKINGKNTKYILREIARELLPHSIHHQPKRGFEIPLKKWMNDDLKELVYGYLQEPKYINDYVSRDFINKLVADKLTVPSEKRAKMLYNLLVLEIWLRNYNKK